MKRFALAFENEALGAEDEVKVDETIVFEDDAQIGEEVAALEEMVQEIEADFKEEERVADISENLEDIATVADSIEEPTATETALMQTAANMAVAGTEDDATTLLPATESFASGKQLATELRKKIQVAQESMGTAHLSIWQKIKNAVAGFFSFFTKMKNKMTEIKKAMEVVEQTKPKATFSHTFKTRSTFFTDKEGKAFSSLKDLTAANLKTANELDSISKISIAAVKNYELYKDSSLKALINKEEYKKKLSDKVSGFRSTFFEDFAKIAGAHKTVSGAKTAVEIPFSVSSAKYSFAFPTTAATEVNEILASITEYKHQGVVNKVYGSSKGVSITGVTFKDVKAYITSLEKSIDVMLKLDDKEMYSKVWDAEAQTPTEPQHTGNMGATVVATAIYSIQMQTDNAKFKNKQAAVIFNIVSTMGYFVESLLSSNLQLINLLVEEKYWKAAE